MSGAYQYKPKFVDIRVRPPKPEDPRPAEPAERRCDHANCRAQGTARAPRGRGRTDDWYWFCPPHAAEYNRNWDFFDGMNEREVKAAQTASIHGDRPTWAFKASPQSREAAAFAARMGTGKGYRDAHGLFGDRRGPSKSDQPAARHLGKLERTAFADMDLDEAADGAAIRAKYTELVKRFHPDSNGGDRSAEQKLQRVIKAFRTLKNAKLV